MPLSRTLSTLGRLVRRRPPPPPDLLEAYAHEVIPVLDRAEWLYQFWLEQSTLFSDSEKLGNVAAIHRWETATMARSLERVIPPAALADAHGDVLEALDMASRAAQLLSSGSRFHNANALCEGQALLLASRERRIVALKAMRRYIPPRPAPLPVPVEPSGPDAPAAQAPGTGPAGSPTSTPAASPAAPAATSPASPPAAEAPATPPEVAPDAPPAAPAEASPEHTTSGSVPAVPPPAPQATAPTVSPDQPDQPDQPADERPAGSGWGHLFGQPRRPEPPA